MNSGIKEKVINEIIDLAKRYNIQTIILFGSRARGDFHKTSDIDIAVKGGDIITFSIDVEEETSTLLRYDVVNLDKPVQKELLDSIQREGVCIYEKI